MKFFFILTASASLAYVAGDEAVERTKVETRVLKVAPASASYPLPDVEFLDPSKIPAFEGEQ